MGIPFDYFADPTKLNFKKSENYKTRYGFIFTIIFLLCVLGIFIQSLIGMLSRQNPSSNTTELYVDDPALTNIRNLPMAFTLTSRENRLIPLVLNYHFTLKAYNEVWEYFIDPVTQMPNMIPRPTPMTIGPCDASYFEGNEELVALSEQLVDFRGFFCIPRTQASDDLFNIQGKIGTPGYQYLKVEFEVCNQPGCASATDLATALATTNIVFAYSDSYVDINNFQKPVQPSKGGHFDHLNINYWREKFIELTPIEVTSDDGLLFGTNNVQTGFTFDVKETVFDPPMPLSDVRFTFYIRLSNRKIIINRTYKKIQDVLADTTGIASTLALIFLIVLKPYIRIKKSEEMISAVLLSEKDNAPKVTFWDYIKSLFGNKTAKRKMEKFYKQEEAVEKRMDILSMIKNMLNIERVMYLSFSPEQKVLIGNLVALSNDPNEEDLRKDLEQNPDIKTIQAIKAISAKRHKDNMDLALLEYHKAYKIKPVLEKDIEAQSLFDSGSMPNSPNMSMTMSMTNKSPTSKFSRMQIVPAPAHDPLSSNE